MKGRGLWPGLVVLGLVLLGCSPAQAADRPPDIRYGEDSCVECNMIISEPRFAAAYTTAGGEARRFDDIGGMCQHYLEMQEEVVSFWVHDYVSEEWLPAEEAFFVLGEGIYTPMAFGVVAFAERTAAEGFADERRGVVLSFDHLLEHYRMGETQHLHDGSLEPSEHKEHEASHDGVHMEDHPKE